MTLSADGGPALPVKADTTRTVQGGAAIPVYGYTTAPTDGRPALAGPALPVRVLTAADLKQNGGQWTVEGRPHAMPVYTAPAGVATMGGPALAVYPVNAWPTVTPATPWYLSGGIASSACVAAYLAKGAASLAASYVNLANPGTNDAALGVAPSFNAATGWTFNGTSQYLIAPAPSNGYSIFMQYANLAAAGTRELFAVYYDSGDIGMWYVQVGGGNMTTASGSAAQGINATELLTGNYGFAGKTPYRDGVAESNVIGAGTGIGHALYIAAMNFGGTPANYSALEVRAFVMYNTTITAPQALALKVAMAAL